MFVSPERLRHGEEERRTRREEEETEVYVESRQTLRLLFLPSELYTLFLLYLTDKFILIRLLVSKHFYG